MGMDYRRSICVVALVVGAMLCAMLASCACAPVVGGADRRFEDQGFYAEDGRYAYSGTMGTATKTGVDVSSFQEYIDWDEVAADGIDFAIVSIGYRGSTEGDLYYDDYYEYNLAAAREAGIERGVYFFSQAVSVEEAREEAEFVVWLLDGEPLEYPVAFDYEIHAAGAASRIQGVSDGEATAIALAFCQAIEDAGYDAMIYGNSYDLEHFDLDALSRYPLWFAEYGSTPSYDGLFGIWQYSCESWVEGIDTVVDLNLDMAAVGGW